jgi:DNA-binding NarL/FixJ family response regulator
MRLLIVDDNAPFLEAARNLLEREGITVVAVAATSAEARRLVDEARPDVALVDVDLGADSGFDLTRELAALTGGTRSPVILMSVTPEQDLVDLLDASPAIGFVAKSDLSGRAIARILADAGLRPPRAGR